MEVIDRHPLNETWYDLRTWLQARTHLLAAPEIALQGQRALGFSPAGYARYMWLVLPTALLAACVMVATVFLETPASPYEQTAERLSQARAELIKTIPPADAKTAKRMRPRLKSEREALHAELATQLGLLGMPQMDAALRDSWAKDIVRVTLERARALPPEQGAAMTAYMARRLHGGERKLRFMNRWAQSGAANLSGLLFTGLLIWVVGAAFRGMVRRLGPDYVSAGKASDVFLYYVTARQFPFLVVGILATVIGQVAFWMQRSQWSLTATSVAALASLCSLSAYWRSGPAIATVLLGQPADSQQGRTMSWRLLWCFLLLQFIAALWVLLFMLGTDVYFAATS